MLTQHEIEAIQKFYSSEEELALLEAALYFQKMMIFKYQFDDTSFRLSAGEETCYSVSVKDCRSFEVKGQPASLSAYFEQGIVPKREYDAFIHLIVYQDCINVQLLFEKELFEDVDNTLIRKAKMLMSRTNYLKEMKVAEYGGNLALYCWINKGRNYYNKTIEAHMKEIVWLFRELNAYMEGQAAKYEEWRGRTVAEPVDAQ